MNKLLLCEIIIIIYLGLVRSLINLKLEKEFQ